MILVSWVQHPISEDMFLSKSSSTTFNYLHFSKFPFSVCPWHTFLECLACWWISEELAGSSMSTNRLCFSSGSQLSMLAGLLWEYHLLQRNPPTAWSYMASGRSGTPIWVETSVQHPAFSDPQLCLVPEFTLALTQLQQASTQVGERIYCHVASYSNFPPVLISALPVHWQKWSFFWKTLPPYVGFSFLCLARSVIESESGSHSVMFNSLWPPCNLLGSSVHGILKARILKCFAIPFFTGPHFVRNLHHDTSVFGGPTRHGS